MKLRKHADLIKAWADGHEIQRYSIAAGEWQDVHLSWYPGDAYRIKPERKRYRVAEMSSATTTVDNERQAKSLEDYNLFIRWLTDWVEYD